MIVAESFLPRTNGVVNTVMRVAKYLRGTGHEVLILAPGLNASRSYEDVPIVRTASVVIPGIPETDLAFVSTAQIVREIRKFTPDVIHLASPF
ncbi:MAG: glycosyltransferase, partial [Actinomycetes bacterium]